MSIDAKFVHLHVHSEFSLLDGAVRIPKLLSACEQREARAIAITDKGNLFGAIDFYFGAKSKGLHPIIGCELFITDDMTVKAKTMERIILLCQNQKGYENLCQIISAAHIKGFYYQPRVDIDLLKEHSEGLICISPGYWGPIAQLLQS
ncbi:MAG: PHP domain-containing protein, partial [Candidatus Margulisiibacteriota bacterium]